MIACFPKSGSTFLTKSLCLATGFPLRHVSARFGHNEQDVLDRRLRRLAPRAVVHQHIKGTCNNVALMKQYGVRPVVLVRNIMDALVSLDDHLRNEDLRVPTGFVHREFLTLDFDRRIDYLIRLHLPWYFHFFMSWREAAAELEVFQLSYERMFSDAPQGLMDVLDFYRVPTTREHATRVIEQMNGANTRFNKGVSGRGEQLLGDHHKRAIHELAAAWNVDAAAMAVIGLGPSAVRPAVRQAG